MYRDHPLPPAARPVIGAKQPSFDELKTLYLQHMTLRNLSLLTIKQVEQYLRLFIAWLEGQGITSVDLVDREVMECYKAHLTAYRTLRGTQLALMTMRAKLFTIGLWFRFLRRKGRMRYDPMVGLRPPHTVKRLPRGVMTHEEIKKVMAQPDLRSVMGYRDRTIMEVLYSTGVRAAELAALEVADIDFEKRTARIRNGKGSKERYVLLSPPCVRFLERYLEVIRPELAQGIRPAGNNWLKKYQTGGNLLFLSAYGGPMGRTWLTAAIKRYIQKAGIFRPVSPLHGWRHSISTHLMEAGMDIRYVQAMLGHATLAATQIYTHVEKKSLQKKLKHCHPSEGRRFVPFLGELTPPAAVGESHA
ncbi:MAG: tyrosine-type recombinase/integrase [Elusimicrobiota bacterium]|jgi:integrase/recombinase XerD